MVTDRIIPIDVPASLSVYVGQTGNINPTAGSASSYVSSNSRIATVSVYGAVTGHAAGTATVTVTDASGNTDTTTVTVIEEDVPPPPEDNNPFNSITSSSGQATYDTSTSVLSIPAVDLQSLFGITSYRVDLVLIPFSNPMSFSVDMGTLAVTTAGDEVSHSTYSDDGTLIIPAVEVGSAVYRVEMRATTVDGALAFELTGAAEVK